ncbi:hypothetical protein B0J15DRAFT_494984, partial [Fusarium solani]
MAHCYQVHRCVNLAARAPAKVVAAAVLAFLCIGDLNLGLTLLDQVGDIGKTHVPVGFGGGSCDGQRGQGEDGESRKLHGESGRDF